MTNSAFQGGDTLLKILSALAIHLLKCMAEAEIDACSRISALKSGVSQNAIAAQKTLSLWI